MSTMNLIWIVVVIVAILVIALSSGLLLARKRRINLGSREQAAPEEKPPQAKGGYQAGSGFNFSSGGTTAVQEPPAPPAGERTEVDGQPAVGDDAAVPRDAPRRGIVDVALPEAPEEAPAQPSTTESGTAQPGTESGTAPTESGAATDRPVTDGAGSATTDAPGTATTDASGTTAAPAAPDALTTETAPAEAPTTTERPVDPPPAADTQAAQADGVVTAPTEVPTEKPTAATEAPAVAPVETVEEIEPPAGRLERLRGRLSRSRSALGQGLLGLLGAGDLDEESWEEIEDTLLMADLGAATTTQVVERLRAELSTRAVRSAADARGALRDVLVETLRPEMDRSVRALPHGDPGNGGRPAVVLVVGVNGTGKTTTTGKLARVLVADGRRLLLGAADTFRAAAVEQLATWAERVGAEVVRGKEKADPASVAFDAVKRGIDSHVDAVLVDTAGRLHTKTGLMDELGKVKRVVEKQAEVDEVLLVLDATTGQNGLTQARVFSDIVEVTGIVLTKLDGTAKGGIVFQVQRELGVPVKLVGLGEGPDDLAPFEPSAFVDALLG